MDKLIEKLKGFKTEHELPNDNTTEYNVGYVKAINDVLNVISKTTETKVLNIADVMAMLPTENEADEWFTYRSENPPHTNIKDVRAIESANKYRAIMLQRLEKLQGN